jgi:hypothetical protein
MYLTRYPLVIASLASVPIDGYLYRTKALVALTTKALFENQTRLLASVSGQSIVSESLLNGKETPQWNRERLKVLK